MTIINRIFNAIKGAVSLKTPIDKSILMPGRYLTIVVPAVAETEDEKAEYILDAVQILETYIQLIKPKEK